MELYGHHFIYGGIPSRAAVRGGTADLVFANVETSRYKNVQGETESMSVFNRHNNRRYLTGTSYDSSPIEFELEIVSEVPLDPYEMRELEKWLFHQAGYTALYIDTEDIKYNGLDTFNSQAVGEYLNCIFTNPKKLEYNGGVIGWRCTIECDAPMVWQDKSRVVFSAEDTPRVGEEGYTFRIPQTGEQAQTVEVVIDTDLNDYVYPIVTMDVVGSAATKIINISDSVTRGTEFTPIGSADTVVTIVMNGELNQLSNTAEGDNYYNYFSSRNFIRLKDGVNRIVLSENIKYISFEWQNMRWL